MFAQLIDPITDSVVRAASGGLASSELAKQAPELVAVILVAGLILAGVWRILSKVQEGHDQTVARFLGHIEKAGERHEELAESTRRALEENGKTLEKVQASMDRNTEMLGRAAASLERSSASLERSNETLERLEQVVLNQKKGGA